MARVDSPRERYSTWRRRLALCCAFVICAPAQANLNFSVVCNQPGLSIGFAECAALVSLYNSTRGDDWSNKSGWGSANVATWFGLGIDAVGRTVLSIDLPSNNLEGIVPASLDQLPNLQTLLLDGNRLADRIPARLGNLSKLRNLGLADNFLIGTLPPEIGNLAQLRSLFLDGNALDGPIPSSFAQLDLLQALYLFDNQLSGPLDVLAEMPALRTALLGGNAFTGSIPARLGQLPQLRSLFLDRNDLRGPIPACLGSATSLEALVLFENELDGTLPPSLGNLTQLGVLSLGKNRLRGTVPTTFAALPLDLFDISVNRFDAEPGGFATIPPALQTWFAGISTTNISAQQTSAVVYSDGFDSTGCSP